MQTGYVMRRWNVPENRSCWRHEHLQRASHSLGQEPLPKPSVCCPHARIITQAASDPAFTADATGNSLIGQQPVCLASSTLGTCITVSTFLEKQTQPDVASGDLPTGA
jgi:hypothetical protein